MKTINKLGIFALTISLLLSCKKMTSTDEHLSNSTLSASPVQIAEGIKNWAYTQPFSIGKFLTELDGKKVSTAKFIQWQQTRYFPDAETSITPVKTGKNESAPVFKFLVTKTSRDGKTEKGNYYDVMSKGGIDRNLVTPEFLAFEKIPKTFSGAVIMYDMYDKVILSKHFENGAAVNKNDIIKIRKKTKAVTGDDGPEGTVAPENGGCTEITIDWYWQTFSEGVLVYEEYLYSTTEIICDGSGGGSGENPYETCNNQFNALINGGVTTSALISTTTNYAQPAERQYTYKWKALQGVGFSVYSFDIGTQEKTANPQMPWKWKSIIHSSIQINGAGIGGMVEKVGEGTLSVTLGNINANVTLDFTLKYTPNCGISGAPTLNPFNKLYHSQIVFSIYTYAGGPTPTLV